MEAYILMFLQAVSAVIIIDAVLSWIQPPSSFPRSVTSSMTAPLYAPIRGMLSPQATGGIDFSPIIILVAINMLSGLVVQMF